MEAKKRVYSVSKISTSIQGLFEQEPFFQNVCVKGEIGTLRPWNYGIVYLNLKESDYVLPCMLTSSCTSKADFQLKEGMTVTLEGSIISNPKKGSYYLKAHSMSNGEDLGDALKKLLQLKEELKELGMFDSQYKLPIPKIIKTLGVVSSESGAVINDIINVTKRRNPYVNIVLSPSLVSGEGATPSIVRGIQKLEEYGCDVIIVGRGGGSQEDLWVYNNREIAEAAFNCSVPIVSAVGHEIDFTILDMVADERASTPSQAAEIAVNDIGILFDKFNEFQNRLNNSIHSKIVISKSKINSCASLLKACSPQSKILRYKAKKDMLNERYSVLMHQNLSSYRHKLEIMIEKFKGLSPLDKLNQGYAYVSINGKTLNSVSMAGEGDKVDIFVKDGVVKAMVEGTESIDFDKRKS